MGTGSGHDLCTLAGVINNVVVEAKRINVGTAYGKTSAKQAAIIDSHILRGRATPYLLNDTPWVLSLGLGIMVMGYSFVWIAGSLRIFIAPDGSTIESEVHGNTPEFRIGREDQYSMVYKVIPRPLQAIDDSEPEEDPIRRSGCGRSITHTWDKFTPAAQVDARAVQGAGADRVRGGGRQAGAVEEALRAGCQRHSGRRCSAPEHSDHQLEKVCACAPESLSKNHHTGRKKVM